MGDKIEQPSERVRRRRLPKLLLPLFLAVLAGLTVYNSVQINAAVNQGPGKFGTSLLSISATYSFGLSSGQQLTIVPGSTGTFSLQVQSNANNPTTIILFYNSTSPESYSASGQGGAALVQRDITISLDSVPGRDLGALNSATCQNDLANPLFLCSQSLGIVPGRNIFTGTVTISGSASLGTFDLTWYGQPA